MFGESADSPGFFKRFHFLSNEPDDSVALFTEQDLRQAYSPGGAIDS
jgi:hypothetical protein